MTMQYLIVNRHKGIKTHRQGTVERFMEEVKYVKNEGFKRISGEKAMMSA